MKDINDMNKKEEYTGREWEELASLLSEEEDGRSDLLDRFLAGDDRDTEKHWKGLKVIDDDKEINVDRAWNTLWSRLNENGLAKARSESKGLLLRIPLIRVAATLLILLGIGSGLIYLNNRGFFNREITIAAGDDQQNVRIALPDGSTIFLNRNTKVTYNNDFIRQGRKVTLSGEAFFDIVPDETSPFTVDAGNASIKVLGTSFSVLTSNDNSEVEVFVQTGKVLLSGNSGTNNLVVDPGYIATVGAGQIESKLNTDPNYLSWNTGRLVYTDQKLSNVFTDLKKVYGIGITTEDSAIPDLSITTTFENQSHETIMLIICTTFNLSFTRDGNVYHLFRK